MARSASHAACAAMDLGWGWCAVVAPLFSGGGKLLLRDWRGVLGLENLAGAP